MAAKNFYQVLGVPDGASADEIKKAYRKLAKKNHPDATGGDKAKEARFKEISEAYETLGDEKKRAAYDEMRRNPFAGGGPPGGGFPGAGYPGAGGVEFDLGDLFSQFGRSGGGSGRVNTTGGGISDLFNMFGGGGAQSQRAPRRGQDVVTRLEVELPEAALGGERTIVIEGKRLTIKIPRGISEGKTIRLAGQGEPGPRGGSAGDLLIEIHERPHPRFRHRAAAPGANASGDIEVEVPLPLDVAVLGGKAEVPTLEGGAVTVTIPPSTSSGKKLRLRGKGAYAGAARGDLYAITQIEIPSELSTEAKDLIVEFARLSNK